MPKQPEERKYIRFDTSAFLPTRGRKGYNPGAWERFGLLMTDAEEAAIFARREAVWEACSRAGITGPGRRFDRAIVQRFHYQQQKRP